MHAAVMIHTGIIYIDQGSGVTVGCYLVQAVFLHTFIETGVAAGTESGVK